MEVGAKRIKLIYSIQAKINFYTPKKIAKGLLNLGEYLMLDYSLLRPTWQAKRFNIIAICSFATS
jgi:hypothetical protein